MPTLTRPLAAPLLAYSLQEEAEKLTRSRALARSGRSARTLLKDGGMRAVLVALAPGGAIAEHAVRGAALVQPLAGEIVLRGGGISRTLRAGELLSIGAGVGHSVESPAGGVFLVVVCAEGAVPLFGEAPSDPLAGAAPSGAAPRPWSISLRV